jgi:(2R)-sulfolactate sulfo-lyase subunit alpha
MIQFLIHEASDNVGVAVVDIAADSNLIGRDLHSNAQITAHSEEAIPLGHKFALKDFVIGRIVQPVNTGHLVHVHNLKTKRWA